MSKTAQRLGFTLSEVADLVATGTHHHGHTPDAGPQARATAKLAEVEQKIIDLTIIRDTLREAVNAGCDDVIACAGSPCCPLPFTDLAHTRSDPANQQ